MKVLNIEKSTDNAVFETMIKSGKPVLVFHHAKWCGHCIIFKSKWNAITTALASNKDVHVVAVEQTYAPHIKKYTDDIRSYPTIRVFKNGKVASEFTGDRSKTENVIAFAKSFITKATPKPTAIIAKPKTVKKIKMV